MRASRIAGTVVAVMALFAALAGIAAAQSREPSGTGKWEPGRLRRAIEERYRVVPLQEGIALVPRTERGDVRSIEIAGSTVAINGTVVTGAELRERVKADSDAILALSYLDPAERKALFEGPADRPAEERPPAEGERPREVAPEDRGAIPPPETPLPDRRSHADARIHIGGGVQVGASEVVDGPVVAVGGPVTVDGEVRQDVVAVGGSVRLGPSARVRGDVTSVGGTIDRDEHAQVDGRLNEIGLSFPHWRLRPGFQAPFLGLHGALGPGVDLMATGFRMLLFGLLVVLAFLIARTPVERIERIAAVEPWKAGLVGLLTELLFVPVFVVTIVVLAVSIIGIPLLLFVPPLALVAFIVALIIGFAGVAYHVGRWAQHTFGWSGQSALVLVIVGLLGIWALTIIGRAISLAGWPVWIVSAALLVVGFVVEYVAWTVGLGAAVMTRLGTRSGPYVAPPPPPPPAAAAPPVA
ncbi:MAG: hypothetical protein ACM3NQ_04935 [Bacteroidales bacterium]